MLFIVILCLFNSYQYVNTFGTLEGENPTKKPIDNYEDILANVMKKKDALTKSCPLNSHFYNGSCYFYLSTKVDDKSKKVQLSDMTLAEAAKKCHTFDFAFKSELWDIDTLDEFDNVSALIYNRINSTVKKDIVQKIYIAVNFTNGKNLLHLNDSIDENQNISHGNSNTYVLKYAKNRHTPLANSCLIMYIDKKNKEILLKSEDPTAEESNHYICKAKIDWCYNNTHCKHGQCESIIYTYKCICNLMFEGDHCDIFFLQTKKGVQSVIAFGLIGLAISYLILHSIVLKKCLGRNKKTENPSIRRSVWSNPLFLQNNRKSTNCLSSHCLCNICLGFFTSVFVTLCCILIYRWKLSRLNDYKQHHNILMKNNLCINELFSSKLNEYYKIPASYISLGILLILIVSQFYFAIFSSEKKLTWKNFWKYLSIPTVFNAHSYIFRFQSAAVFGIIALEILNILDEFIINGATHFDNGPLVDLLLQFGIGLLLGLRYCPILAIFEREYNFQNRVENRITYGLGAVYLYCEILSKFQSDIGCVLNTRKISFLNETLQRFNRLGANATEYITDIFVNNRTTKLNKMYQDKISWLHNKTSKRIENSTEDYINDMKNELASIEYSLELNLPSIVNNVLRNVPYYFFIIYLAFYLTNLFFNVLRKKFKKSYPLQSLARWKYVKYNLLTTTQYIHLNEQRHYSCLFRCFNSLCFFKKNTYPIRSYFRYSKLIVCIYTSALTLTYYFTFWIQENTYMLTKKLLFLLNSILCAVSNLSKDSCYSLNLDRINQDIKYICLFTALVTCIQLFLGLRNHKNQMCKAYQGIVTDIPKLEHLSSVSIVSKSIRYPGRFIGSLVYSYGFLFVFLSIVYVIIRYIVIRTIVLKYGWQFFVPMIIFFSFQLLLIRFLCKLLFLKNSRLLALRNLRIFHTFSYFSFFFDCFLGFIMCVSRISKGIICVLIFFARLDYTPYGRGLEMWDSSYAAYVSFFHLEKHQQHPVLNVFIDIVRQRLIDKRKLQLNSSINRSQRELLMNSLRKKSLARFRWALIYTLINNEQLKRNRKFRLHSNQTVQSRTLVRLFNRLNLA